MTSTPDGPTRMTIVTSPGCHLCHDAQVAVAELGAEHDLQIELIDASSPDGLRLIGHHRPAMNPLVLVDGAYFSSGRLPRGKLKALLSNAEPMKVG